MDVLYHVDGELAAKRNANYEIKWYSVMTVFYAAAAIISGIDYFGAGSSSSEDTAQRLLAAAVGVDGDTNHIPIALLLVGAMCHPLGVVFAMFRGRWIKDYKPQE